MTIKAILPFGDPTLRKFSKPVENITPRIIKLLDDMTETLYASDGRAGLASPQVGILRRIIVMDCGEGLIELINPEIIYQSGEQTGPEGCLSYPGYAGVVRRFQSVKIKSLTRSGSETIIEGEGLLARCIQHEIDHLNGILYIDHIKDGLFYNEETNMRANLLEVTELTYSN
ncbi:peptide deformylase [Paenibacillus marchantiophytorum]|uniref:Peptide deformylase n=1 Tax=Paenibacillus marchantiophytorum TaxID=1619310 RepID=A0ABQ1EZU9_9BACL|nr:peptide deformylase [Paenibacillus marchantiophytorum]GFZ93548.1 peptide deformylase [Paenibacillus marchantiophytorum]